MMIITYYDTLYNRNATMMTDSVEFKEKGIEFKSMGRGYFLRYEYIVRIEIAP